MAVTRISTRKDHPKLEDDAEESDEYEVGDEESEDDEDEEDEEDEDEEAGGGLTAMLLRPYDDGEDDDDKGWVPDGGREPADYSGDEDEDEQAPEGVKVEQPEKPPSKTPMSQQIKGSAVGIANGSNKRAREEEPSEEHSGKKAKV